MKRTATVVWRGDLRLGSGTLSTESKALVGSPISFGSRFENLKGSNPEELIAAALASCFSMAMSMELAKIKFVANLLEVNASVEVEKTDGYSITKIHLNVKADIPNVSDEQFDQAIGSTMKNCPVAKLLNVPISVEKKLTSSVVSYQQEAG